MKNAKKHLILIPVLLSLVVPIHNSAAFSSWSEQDSFDSGHFYKDEDGALVERTQSDWQNDFEESSRQWQRDFEASQEEWEIEFNNFSHGINDDWNNDEDDSEDNESDYTRAEARAEIRVAEVAIEDLKLTIQQMEDDNAEARDIKKAKRVLTQAEGDLEDAWENFEDRDYDRAVYEAKRALSSIEALPEYVSVEVPDACLLSAATLATITNFPPSDGPIIAFGDSLTAGIGASIGKDYVSELRALTGENIINAGISGDTTQEALARLERDVLSRDPSVVIVWLGGNDFLARYYQELENETEGTFLERVIDAFYKFIGKNPRNDEAITENETFANLEIIVEQIQNSGAVVVLVGMDGEPVERNLNRRYKDVAEDTGALFVEDVLDGIIGRPSLTSDLIHPNNAGYELVARRIYPAVACTL